MKTDFFSKLSEIKGIRLMIALLVIGAALIAVGALIQNKNEDKSTAEAFSRTEYEKEIEERIAKIVSEMGGISEVSVMVTLESTVSYSYAENDKGNSSEYVTVRDKDGSERGVILSENTPSVRGVAVVCKGGDKPEKKLEIIKLVSALLKLPENRVYVGPRS